MTTQKVLGKEITIVIITIISLTIMIISNNNRVYTNFDNNNNKITGLLMKADNIKIGIVSTEDIGKKAIKTVEEKYLSKINRKEIKDVVVNNKITYEKVECYEEELSSSDKISSKIIEYNNTHNKKIISFTLIKENEAVPVLKPVVIKQVYLNQSLHTPTVGWLSSGFGERDGVMHKGIDFAANCGTPIEAALDGKVTYSGTMGTFGKIVILQHNNNMETFYAHCNKLYVSVGENVVKGQHIADVGSTGNSTGPHLHFEIRLNGKSVDPLKYSLNKQY